MDQAMNLHCFQRAQLFGLWVGILIGLLLGDFAGLQGVTAQELPDLPRVAPTERADSLRSFRINPDLEVQLVAAEPEVIDPVALDFDEYGRVFVVEMRGYSEAGQESLGRIRRLVDSDGNGQFEQAAIFADGFRNPTAVVCCFGGIMVGDAPDLIFLKDRNDDGQADTRLVLFTGFGTANIQQLLNNLQWGIDGRLIGASGGNPGEVKRVAEPWPFLRIGESVKDAKAVELRGRDFVIDLRSGWMEATTGGGQFGLTLDRWGNRYVCSNSDHCQQIVLDARELRSNPLLRTESLRVSIAEEGPAASIFRASPVEAWRIARTEMRVQGRAKGPIEGGGKASGYFSGATGICYYDGDALGEEFLGNLFVADAGSNLVHRKRLVDTQLVKSAVRVEQGREFLASTDNWFRPVQLANAPDGSLIILDMYREVVEHPASLPEPIKRQLDLSSGNDRGRIYRIVPKGQKPAVRAMPGNAGSLPELVEMLGHANGWHRRTAARLLRERGDPEASKVIEQWLARGGRDQGRLLALYLLRDWGTLSEERVLELLDQLEANWRVHGLRLASGWSGENWELARLRLLNDADQRVQVQAILSLADSKFSGLPARLASAAWSSVSDAWVRTAVLSSSARFRGKLLDEYLKLLDKEIRPGDLAFLGELVRQIGNDNDEGDGRRLAVAVLTELERRPMLAGTLWNSATEGSPERVSRLVAWAEQENPQLASGMLERLAVRAGELTVRSDVPVAERLPLVPLLASLPAEDLLTVWGKLFDGQQAPEIRLAAVDLAGQVANAEMGAVLVVALPELSPVLRARTVSVLIARPLYSRLLLEGIESGMVSGVLLPASSKQQLKQHPEVAIRERAERLLSDQGDGNRRELIERTQQALVGLAGERQLGREVFRKHCSSCHRLEDVGENIGPELTGYAYRTREDLLLHVLDPNREVDSRYLAYSVELGDGRLLLGVLTDESESGITLRTADGQRMILNRSDVESIRSTSKSLMPENLSDELTPEMLADLSAYLQSLRD